MKLKLKQHVYDIFNILLLNLLFIIPMSGVDYTSYLSHDARWWLNQYYEFYKTFGHHNDVAFNAFNHTGLAINILYPQSILKLLETPLVIFHVENPYLVMGILTLTIANTYLVLNYIIFKKLQTPIPLSAATLATSILLLTGRGIINSLPQLLATIFILIGVIAIIDEKKRYLMIISTYGMLSSSLTTSIIGAMTLTIIFFIQPNWQKLKQLTAYGVVGVILSLPELLRIFHLIKYVHKPYPKPMQEFPTFIITSHATLTSFLFILVAIFSFLIPLALKNNHKLNKYIGTVIAIYITISAFPQFASKLMAPIQEGTFQRVWTLFAIVLIFWIAPIILKKYQLVINILTSFVIVLSLYTYIYYPIQHAVETPLIKSFKLQKWDDVYAIINTDMFLQDKSKQILIKPDTFETATYSPDYIPKNATIKENIIAYTSPIKMKSKYGVIKYPLKSNALKISVNPKQKITPLGVWHYKFIKYSVSTTQGRVIVKNGMYEYIGDKPATITIESGKHD